MSTYLGHVWSVMLELAPWLLLGAAVSGLLHYLVPPGMVRRQLSGPWGVVKAVLLGIPLPLCSCGVIPAGLGLARDGASKGASVGFLVATPQTGVDSVLVSAGLLGWPFALWKVGAALVTGLAAGWTTDAIAPAPEGAEIAPVAEHRPTVRAAVEHAIDVIREVWVWLAFGVLVSAGLSTFLPVGAFADLTTGATLLAFGAALGISLPLYVCATASVPIAAALVAAGMPTGAALVFLMAGPATNVATVGAVYRAFGRNVLAVYLTTIVAGSVAFGVLYEQVFGALAGTVTHAHEHTTWWATASALGLLGLMAWFALEELRRRTSPPVEPAVALEVAVSGMTCGGCAKKVQRALLATDGVEAAEVSVDDGVALVTGHAPFDRIQLAIEEAGFSAAR